MNLTYLRNRARQLRRTQDKAGRQDLFYKLAIHLGFAELGQQLTQEQQQQLILKLRKLGININHRSQEQVAKAPTGMLGNLSVAQPTEP